MVKKYLLIILLVILCYQLFGQKQDSIELGYPFHVAPEFKGDLRNFIQRSIVYPENSFKDSIEGRVIISYKVDTLGNTFDHVVERGICEELDKEALRVTKLIQYKKPAYYNNKPVIFYFSIPVLFKVDSTKTLNFEKKKCF